uniref:F-box/FBD/LRR-repeat protein At3g26920-like n=1 Tax=Fragaria vesca subsp. vesca TaxID=101020 RepID=UPI0005CA6C56|nr:PREDICTED: F-box/FBD/LRR-repeat protein At3g26920-like [Fragaria vesca subsp. vesca]
MRGIPFSSYSLDDPKSLVKANIHLKGHQSGNRVPVDRALLAEISGVQHLSIPAPCLEAISFMKVCDLPAFGHLKKLKLNDWELLAINFLNVSPNLEDLGTKSDEECIELQWNLPETVPVCLSSHLKTICIIGFKGWKFEMEAAKYLLKNGRAFKKMIIYTANDLPSMKANKLPKNFSCFKRPVKWNLSTCDLEVSAFRL